jgi:hypothetical protein
MYFLLFGLRFCWRITGSAIPCMNHPLVVSFLQGLLRCAQQTLPALFIFRIQLCEFSPTLFVHHLPSGHPPGILILDPIPSQICGL